MTFDYWIARLGETQARRESAPPGHSEHQLGTTADVISIATRGELLPPFGDTAEGLRDTDYARFIGASLEAFTTWIRDRYAPDSTPQAIADRYSELVTEEVLARRLPPFDGAIELLEALGQRGVLLAVASQSLPAW